MKALAVMLYGEGVMSISRITSLLNDLGGRSLKLSEGSVYGFCRKFAQRGKGCKMPGGKAIEPGSRINGRNRSHAEWGAELYP